MSRGDGDGSEKKPDPIEDVRKGLGLLFRAAKTAIKELPADNVKDAITTGAREVGRAIEHVAERIDEEVLGGAADRAIWAPRPPDRARGDGAREVEPDDDEATKTRVRVADGPASEDGPGASEASALDAEGVDVPAPVSSDRPIVTPPPGEPEAEPDDSA